MKALVVDASKSACNLYRLILERNHIKMDEAHNAKSALHLMAQTHYDLVIFAYDLVDMDGLDFYRSIPATPTYLAQVTLLITSRTDPALLHQALAEGVTACFSKKELAAIEQFIWHFTSIAEIKIKGHVLLVEDSASATAVYGGLLKKMGLSFDRCDSAEAALAKLVSQPTYDLIVTDFSLAGAADAFSLINSVRSQKGQTASIPILVMSGLDTPVRRTQLLLNGANAFFSKAGQPEEFMVSVNQLIQNHSLLKRIEMQYQEMYGLANQDALTQLGNRYQLERLKHQIEQTAKTASSGTYFLLIDIDHFKQVNDKYGHPVGDMVLREVSQSIKMFFSDSPYLFRVGGEEFLVILENSTPESAEFKANAFRLQLENTTRHLLPVTISAGLAQLSATDDFLTAYQAADKALYLAKHAGRNQVHYFESPHFLTESPY